MVVEEDKGEEKQWGALLKASPRKGRFKMGEEVKQFLSCTRPLAFKSLARCYKEKVTYDVKGVVDATTIIIASKEGGGGEESVHNKEAALSGTRTQATKDS